MDKKIISILYQNLHKTIEINVVNIHQSKLYKYKCRTSHSHVKKKTSKKRKYLSDVFNSTLQPIFS